MYWLLAREVLYLRGQLNRTAPWDVMVDLFLYREPEAEEDKEEAKYDNQVADEPADYALAQTSAPAAGGNWEGAPEANWTGDWSNEQAAPAAAAPSGSWDQGAAATSGQSWE